MKAIRVREFGIPEVMKLEAVPDLRPGPGQVVVRVKAAGVNPVDAYSRSGAYARKPLLPYTPGIEAAGVVEAVGEGVTKIGTGDRVFISASLSGTYAEQTLCQAAQVHHLPGNVSFAQGAAVYVPYATAYSALFLQARIAPGEFVLVHGATGGVGTAAVQLARAAGATVIGTGGSQIGRALVLAQGAHHVLDHRATGYLDGLAGITDGHGVDVVIEMLANLNLDKDLKILAPQGRVVVVGNRGRVEIDPRELMSRNASVTGMLLFNLTERERTRILAALGESLANGTLRPFVGKEIPLAEAARAHHEIMEAPAYGKIVLVP